MRAGGGLSTATLQVETAHALGRNVAAHAHGTDGINAALRAGVDSIEHGSFLDDESISLFKRTGAFLVPTILAALHDAGIDVYGAQLRRASMEDVYFALESRFATTDMTEAT